MELTRDQETALRGLSSFMTNNQRMFKVVGLSGTGKTFIVSEFYKNSEHDDMVFLAPTGRAAANLAIRGVPAVTVHSFMYNLESAEGKDLKFVLKDKFENIPRVIFVEEASMVNKVMRNDIMSLETKVVWVGDPGQLPPIGEDPKVLSRPDVYLREVVRQAEGNPIIKLSNMVYNGGQIKQGNYDNKVMVGSRHDIKLSSILSADQVIVATNQERKRINDEVRDHYKRYDRLPVVGDKLVCTRNLWNTNVGGVPIINGMLGYCEKIRMRTSDTALIQFRPEFTSESVVLEMDCLPFIGRYRGGKSDLATFDFGYAITCHKAQGSEWDKVIVIRDMNIPNVSERSWLYTAMTRAKEKLILGV